MSRGQMHRHATQRSSDSSAVSRGEQAGCLAALGADWLQGCRWSRWGVARMLKADPVDQGVMLSAAVDSEVHACLYRLASLQVQHPG